MREQPPADPEIIATLVPSPLRRHMGTGVMVALGIILFYVAQDDRNSSLTATLLFAGMGVGSFLLAYRMHTASANSLTLLADELHSSDGSLIARTANIARVERGLFAFKPSNGFLIVLREPMPFAWHPGLWWRFGRRVGVGGVTPRAESKLMAERIHMLLGTPD